MSNFEVMLIVFLSFGLGAAVGALVNLVLFSFDCANCYFRKQGIADKDSRITTRKRIYDVVENHVSFGSHEFGWTEKLVNDLCSLFDIKS